MTAAPVLDLTARRRGLTIDIEASSAHELIISLGGWTMPDSRPLLEIGAEWFDERRRQASPQLGALLDRFADTGKMLGSLGGMLHASARGRDVASLFALLEDTDPVELWATLMGSHEGGHEAILSAEQIYAAAPDPAARRRLGAILAKDPDCGGSGMVRVAEAEPVEVKRQAIDLLRRWHDEVLADQLATTASALDRDASAKRALAATMAPERLVEAATNGVSYVTEPGIRSILLIPQVAMRPWVLISEHDRTKVIAYPVATESLTAAPDDPLRRLATLCKALAEEQRLRIIRRLGDGPLSLQQIADHLGLAKSTAHHHLVVLRAAGLVRVELGADKEYSLREDPTGELAELLRAHLGGDRR